MTKYIMVITEHGNSVASARSRAYTYLPLLEIDDIKAISFSIIPSFKKKSPFSLIFREIFILSIVICLLPFVEVLFVQRYYPKYFWVTRIIRKLSRRIIYDFDESYHVDALGVKLSQRKVAFFNYFIEVSDCVIVSNPYLESYSKQFNQNILIIPTLVEVDKYQCKVHTDKKPITIGWVGSGGAQQYLETLEFVFEKLYEKYSNDVRLEVVTAASYQVHLKTKLKVINTIWEIKHEFDYFQRFDVGVMPLVNNQRSLGKASYKALQYMASCIPVVASPIGMNNSVILHGFNGFLPKSNEEWFEYLCMLIEDCKLRSSIGGHGKETVEQFSFNKWYPIFKAILFPHEH